MPRVSSLGHIGLFVNDMAAMRDFYTGTLGMTVTDESGESEDRQMVFLSARPQEEHHEILLLNGRTGDADTKIVQQVSFHVDTVEDVRDFHRRLQQDGVTVDSVVTHGNTASVYFRDPEDNRLEIYYALPVEWKQPFRKSIDLEQSDEAVLAQIHDLTFGAANQPVA